MQPRVVAQVLARGQVAVEQRLVPEQPEPGPDGERPFRQRLAEHADLARVGSQQRGQHPQQRRLAGAVVAQDRQRRPRRELQGNVPERGPLAKVAREAAQIKRGRGRAVTLGRFSWRATA